MQWQHELHILRKGKQPKDKVSGRIFLGHQGPRRRYVPDKKTLCKWPFFCCFREWRGCPGIWVGTSRIWKNFTQENFRLIFRSLYPVPLVAILCTQPASPLVPPQQHRDRNSSLALDLVVPCSCFIRSQARVFQLSMSTSKQILRKACCTVDAPQVSR